MIYFDIIVCFERALGTALPQEQRMRVSEQMARQLGGDRHYLPSLPKLQRQVRLSAFGTLTVTEAATSTGIPIRTIKRLRNGK